MDEAKFLADFTAGNKITVPSKYKDLMALQVGETLLVHIKRVKEPEKAAVVPRDGRSELAEKITQSLEKVIGKSGVQLFESVIENRSIDLETLSKKDMTAEVLEDLDKAFAVYSILGKYAMGGLKRILEKEGGG